MQSRLASTVQYLEEKYANHYDDHEDCVISTKRGKVVGKGSHKWLNRLIKVDRDVLEEIDSTLDEVASVAGSEKSLTWVSLILLVLIILTSLSDLFN